MKKTLLMGLMAASLTAWGEDGIVSVDENGNPHTYGVEELNAAYGGTFDQSAFDDFKVYADKTGGTFGFCPQADHLPKVMDQIFESIMNQAAAETDVALVLDVTGSMTDEIDSVKENLVTLIERFQTAGRSDIKISLLIYRDAGDEFVNKVIQDMTSDLQSLGEQVKTITVDGGGDHPEAVLDAIEVAGASLSWRPLAARNMIIIGDAPGHTTSTTTQKNLDQVLEGLATIGTFVIHPLLVSNVSSGVPMRLGH